MVFGVRKLFCFVLIAVVCAPLYAVHPDCIALAKIANEIGSDQILEVGAISAEDVSQLSGMGVFKVPLKSGGSGVLRLDYQDQFSNAYFNMHDTTFEGFATRFANVLGKPLPLPMQVKLASPLKDFLLAAERSARVPSAAVISALQEKQPKAALLPFYPGETGQKYLETQMGLSFRDNLVYYAILSARARESQLDFSRYQSEMITELKTTWDKLGNAAKDSILEDIRQLFPLESFKEETFLAQLNAKLRSSNVERLQGMSEKVFDRLSPAIQTQLAESWAIFTILGIPDFHSGNWMIHEGQIIPIDLASRSAQFTEAKRGVVFEGQQNPVTGGSVTAKDVEKFRSLLSPAFIAKLRSLTVSEITKIAEVSSLKITPEQAEGMLRRSRKLYD